MQKRKHVLQDFLFIDKDYYLRRKIAIKNCLTNMGKWQYKMLITRSTEPCGFRITKWSLNDWKTQVLLCAILKCIFVSQELQQENCSWFHKYFYELLKSNLYLYVYNYHNSNNCRWCMNLKILPSWDFSYS